MHEGGSLGIKRSEMVHEKSEGVTDSCMTIFLTI